MPGPTAWIDLARLRANIAVVRERLPEGVKILFVVKSDAYGHGLVPLARAGIQAGIDRLGIVTVKEGERLRADGIDLPMLLLGPILPREIPRAVALGLTIPVSDHRFGERLVREAKRLQARPSVHIKVDTGMGRFGIAAGEAVELVEKLSREPALYVEGIYTHLSSADSPDPEARAYTLRQIGVFTNLLHTLERRSLLPPLRHIANSAGFIQYQEDVTAPPLNMVRIGTLFYGYPEVDAPWVSEVEPVARLTAPVVALRAVKEGEFVGYARSYRASTPRNVAVIAAGYGTGLPPRLADQGHVWVRGRLAPVVGRIYLDHTVIDVTEVDGVSIGDEVEIIGPHVPADRLAEGIGLEVCELLVPALSEAERRVYDGRI